MLSSTNKLPKRLKREKKKAKEKKKIDNTKGI